MGFSRQEYWSGLQFPPPGDLPDPGMGPRIPALQADSSLPDSTGKPPAEQVRWRSEPEGSVIKTFPDKERDSKGPGTWGGHMAWP